MHCKEGQLAAKRTRFAPGKKNYFIEVGQIYRIPLRLTDINHPQGLPVFFLTDPPLPLRATGVSLASARARDVSGQQELFVRGKALAGRP